MRKLTMLLALALSVPLLAGEEIVLETETGKLFGTLELPGAVEGRLPAVLIHPGSGPTDGDGNSAIIQGKNNSLSYLAEALAAEGIASIRIDKRGIARSMGAAKSEKDLRFDWLRDDERFSTVVMLGHSEGALIGSLAADGHADVFISVAGAGFPADEALRKQLQPKLPPVLSTLFRQSVQPYLISWFKHDPREAIKALQIPVLIVQGDTDIQIFPDDAKALAAAQPKATLVLIEGMNHVLKDVAAEPAAQTASYGDPDLPVNAELVAAVVKIVRE